MSHSHGESETDIMRRFGLARCQRCRRIVLARRLRQGKCREAVECILVAQRKWLDERERPVVKEEDDAEPISD